MTGNVSSGQAQPDPSLTYQNDPSFTDPSLNPNLKTVGTGEGGTAIKGAGKGSVVQSTDQTAIQNLEQDSVGAGQTVGTKEQAQAQAQGEAGVVNLPPAVQQAYDKLVQAAQQAQGNPYLDAQFQVALVDCFLEIVKSKQFQQQIEGTIMAEQLNMLFKAAKELGDLALQDAQNTAEKLQWMGIIAIASFTVSAFGSVMGIAGGLASMRGGLLKIKAARQEAEEGEGKVSGSPDEKALKPPSADLEKLQKKQVYWESIGTMMTAAGQGVSQAGQQGGEAISNFIQAYYTLREGEIHQQQEWEKGFQEIVRMTADSTSKDFQEAVSQLQNYLNAWKEMMQATNRAAETIR